MSSTEMGNFLSHVAPDWWPQDVSMGYVNPDPRSNACKGDTVMGLQVAIKSKADRRRGPARADPMSRTTAL